MKRIPGDERVALGFKAVLQQIAQGRRALHHGPDVDRMIGAAEALALAERALNGVIIDLEALTEVPWGAIMEDPTFDPNPPQHIPAPPRLSECFCPEGHERKCTASMCPREVRA